MQPTVGEEWSTGIVIPPTPIWLGGIISLTFCIGFQCTHTHTGNNLKPLHREAVEPLECSGCHFSSLCTSAEWGVHLFMAHSDFQN